MIRAHTAAVKTLLTTGLPATTEVYVSRATGPAPYVVLHPDTGRGASSRFGGDTDERTWFFATHSVGATTDQAQLVAQVVHSALTDVTPTITSRVCHPIRLDQALPVDVQNDGTVTVHLARDVWRLVTRPA